MSDNSVTNLLNDLQATGYDARRTDMPGLYRIGNGPELTLMQLIQVAGELLGPEVTKPEGLE